MWGENDMPQYNAMFGVTLLLFLNLISIPTVIEAGTGRRLITLPELPQTTLLVIVTGFMVPHYLLLVHRDKYKEIVKQFNREKEKERRRGSLFVWAYIVLTVAALFGSWFGVYLREN